MRYHLQKIITLAPHLRKIRYFESCESTNLSAREYAVTGAEEFTLILTEEQTAGRGRLGRSWTHDGESGIAMSLILRPSLKPESLPRMTLIAALAVHDAVANVCGVNAGIKWPNDILFDGKKLCGILTEGVLDGPDTFAVLGIGMNVNQTELPEELTGIATSLKRITGREHSREELIAGIVEAFFTYYRILQEDGDLRRISERYNRYSILPGGINNLGEVLTK